MQSLYARLPIFAQNLACSWAGWRRSRARFSRHFAETLKKWEQTVVGPHELLTGIQLDRLSRTVERARSFSPAYRGIGSVRGPGNDPEARIREILGALPILEKKTYAENPHSFVASDVPRKRILHGKTSGTTGTALRLFYTPEALAEEYATVWRMRRASGAKLGDPFLSFGGQTIVPVNQSGPPFWRTNWWNRQTLFSLYHMTNENLPAYVEAMHRAPARYVQGYPSSLHLVAKMMLELDKTFPRGRLVAVFTSSESLLAFQREEIEEAFAAPVLDRYGTSELAVSMSQCSAGRMHIDMEFGLVEVEVVEESEDWVRGPLLVTGFANDACPMLRYRIGDVGTRMKSACPCGRPGDSFHDIDGRIEDYVITPSGAQIGRLDHVFKDRHEVFEAQILQESLNELSVLIVPRSQWTQAAEQKLLREFRTRLGSEMQIVVRVVSEIPRESNGKFRAVVSTLSSSAESEMRNGGD